MALQLEAQNRSSEGKADLLPTQKNCLLEWIYDTVTPPTDSCRAWAQTALGKHPSHLFAHAALQQLHATHLQLVVYHPSSISFAQ
jgi:hypothetical protein